MRLDERDLRLPPPQTKGDGSVLNRGEWTVRVRWGHLDGGGSLPARVLAWFVVQEEVMGLEKRIAAAWVVEYIHKAATM